jgi:hypothetical protein
VGDEHCAGVAVAVVGGEGCEARVAVAVCTAPVVVGREVVAVGKLLLSSFSRRPGCWAGGWTGC